MRFAGQLVEPEIPKREREQLAVEQQPDLRENVM
jgi:hypothetical protein